MVFHAWQFFVFFLIVYLVYLPIRKTRFMTLWLLIASYVFYGWWNEYYLFLIVFSTLIDYVAVRAMERCIDWRLPRLVRFLGNKRSWLVLSLLTNLGFLAAFKYADFVLENLNAVVSWTGAGFRFINPVKASMELFGIDYLLPVGISFYTFQSMSYTIDVYRGKLKPEHNFIKFAAFVALFPQLVAGPIERASNLLPQLSRPPKISKQDLFDGASLFLVGFFKKVALADFLAIYVDRIYGGSSVGDILTHVQDASGSELALAIFAFGWQIYFDFSGYTDMARGVARVMGFRLMLNFNNPYIATGLGDFWNRWHISLSTWFKDYVYIPLGGNRHGEVRTYVYMFITMIVSGIWHGAAWGFIIWGALHAVGRVSTRELERARIYREKVPKFVKQLLVFGFVTFTWIFFRSITWEASWLALTKIFGAPWTDPQFPVLMLALVLGVWAYQFLYSEENAMKRVLDLAPVRVGLAVIMVLYLVLLAQPSSEQFIYFQF